MKKTGNNPDFALITLYNQTMQRLKRFLIRSNKINQINKLDTKFREEMFIGQPPLPANR